MALPLILICVTYRTSKSLLMCFRKIEKQSQKVEDEDTEFELTDYVKIDEKDIQFDFEEKEEIT